MREAGWPRFKLGRGVVLGILTLYKNVGVERGACVESDVLCANLFM